MKYFLLFLPAALLAAGCAHTEKTEAITAEITAAQISGRSAAREILSREWPDTAELKKKLLDIRTVQSQYIMKGYTEAGEAFDSTFISTIRAVNPSLASKIRH